jgi:hypothetical protein
VRHANCEASGTHCNGFGFRFESGLVFLDITYLALPGIIAGVILSVISSGNPHGGRGGIEVWIVAFLVNSLLLLRAVVHFKMAVLEVPLLKSETSMPYVPSFLD